MGADQVTYSMSGLKGVLIVTKGEYSDYGILAVFTDRAMADEYAAQKRANVETWAVDDALPIPFGHRLYEVDMDINGNGHVSQSCNTECTVDNDYFYIEYPNRWNMPAVFSGHRCFYVSTDMGEEGAMKIANERRLQLIALNQWPQPGTPAQ